MASAIGHRANSQPCRATEQMENQHIMTSPVTRPTAVAIPAGDTGRVAGRRPTIPAATRHLFGFTVHDPFGLADGEIHIADPVREYLARATISAASFPHRQPQPGPGRPFGPVPRRQRPPRHHLHLRTRGPGRRALAGVPALSVRRADRPG